MDTVKPITDEIFLPVSFEGYGQDYEISNYGTVRRRTNGTNTYIGRVLTPQIVHGYPTVSLSRMGKKTQTKVAKLVAWTFIGPPPASNLVLAHNDGDALNSHADNLRWTTQQDNCLDKIKHGTIARGANNGAAKLSEAEAIYCHKAYAEGKPMAAIAEELGCHSSMVGLILRGKSWGHLGVTTQTRGRCIKKDTVSQIFSLAGKNYPHREISNRVGCSKTRVGDILSGKSELAKEYLKENSHALD